MTPRRRPHRGPAHGGSSPSVVAQQGRTTGRRSVPHVSLGGLSRAAVVWAVALGLLPLHRRQGLGVLWRVARSLEGDRLDHQSHTCDRQAAIRIWARHPGLTGAGEGVTSVPSACQLPEQPPICYHIGCSNVWSRAILSVHCARTSGRAPARGPTRPLHRPNLWWGGGASHWWSRASVASVEDQTFVRAAAVCTLPRRTTSAVGAVGAVCCRGGRRTAARAHKTRTCSRARPRLAVITWGRAVGVGIAAV